MYFDFEWLQSIVYAGIDIFFFSLLIGLPLVLFFMFLEIFNIGVLTLNKNKYGK